LEIYVQADVPDLMIGELFPQNLSREIDKLWPM